LELLEDIGITLEQLYDYAVEHFDREELFMQAYNLPNVSNHLREHARILGLLKESLDDFKLGKVNVSHKLKMQVMEWLIVHINKVDFDFFNIDNWSKTLVDASDWEAVSQIVSLTGINEIDHQHKILTEKAINIMTNIDADTKERDLLEGFKDFKDYVVFHFDYETDLIERYKIKEVDLHLQQHEYFVQRVEAFPKEIVGDLSRVEDLKIWILTWWINHINITDHDTFKYDNWASQVIDQAEKVDEIEPLLRLTGIGTIDFDHLQVMKKTFELHKRIQLGIKDNLLHTSETKTEIVQMLEDIYSLAEDHFHREELIMNKNKLTDYKSHTYEHNNILQKIKEMKTNYTTGRLYASKNIKTVILDWWIHHTNNNDYRTFVINSDSLVLDRMRKEEKYE
jgi:hemerythrin